MAPYKEMRDVIAKKMPGIQMVYLYYDPSKITNIPRKEYWVSDFEEPNLQEHSICFQDTGKKTIAETLAWILPLGIINRKEIEVKIRFNREHKGAEFWRVIYGNKEHLADDVQVQVPMHATHDEIEPGIIKSHFTCLATDIQWNEKNVLIK